ncbi:MAG: tripartite tricarboxylate transporter TctB family protein [Proteobacteria bacterium]|nr:tripartite tricarboxylate transporter TctB family protein [Pseudomonadota bacterium]
MDNESNSGEPEKKHIGSDLVIPAAALAFTLYYFSTIIDSPWTAQVSAFFIGAVLITLIVAFVIYSLLSIRRGEADLGFQRLTEPLSFIPRRAALFALTISFIFFVEWGGFTITTFLFLSGAMLLLSRGRNLKFTLALSAVLAIGGYFLFVYAFEVRFPKGPFELLMAQVL